MALARKEEVRGRVAADVNGTLELIQFYPASALQN